METLLFHSNSYTYGKFLYSRNSYTVKLSSTSLVKKLITQIIEMYFANYANETNYST